MAEPYPRAWTPAEEPRRCRRCQRMLPAEAFGHFGPGRGRHQRCRECLREHKAALRNHPVSDQLYWYRVVRMVAAELPPEPLTPAAMVRLCRRHGRRNSAPNVMAAGEGIAWWWRDGAWWTAAAIEAAEAVDVAAE